LTDHSSLTFYVPLRILTPHLISKLELHDFLKKTVKYTMLYKTRESRFLPTERELNGTRSFCCRGWKPEAELRIRFLLDWRRRTWVKKVSQSVPICSFRYILPQLGRTSRSGVPIFFTCSVVRPAYAKKMILMHRILRRSYNLHQRIFSSARKCLDHIDLNLHRQHGRNCTWLRNLPSTRSLQFRSCCMENCSTSTENMLRRHAAALKQTDKIL